MSNMSAAKAQTQMIGSQGINGRSTSLQVLGNVGTDQHPEVLLAVGLAHAQNALAAVIEELEDLRAEMDSMRKHLRAR